MRIFNVPLTVEQRQMIMMPWGAIPLKVVVKGDVPYLYYQVYDAGERASNELQKRIFRTVCSGESFGGGDYIDTFVLNEWFVGHVYEAVEGVPDSVDTRYAEDFKILNKELDVKLEADTAKASNPG